MNLKTMELISKDEKSKRIEKNVKNAVIEVMRTKVEDLDIDVFRNKVLQCKIGMEYLRDIDMSHRIRTAFTLRSINMISDNSTEKKKHFKDTF